MRFYGGLALLLIAICIGYYQLYPVVMQTEQVRYRITVSINTPEGVRTGSGVWGFSMAPHLPVYSTQWYFSARVDGEAIPIDLPDHRVIYALLGGRRMPRDLGRGMEPAYFDSGMMNVTPSSQLWHGGRGSDYFHSDRKGAQARVAWIRAQLGKTVSLDCSPNIDGRWSEYCPALVTVDSKSGHIELLDPDKLGTTLGSGYYLRGVTLQVVNDPVTHGIERRLPWVKPASAPDLTAGSRTNGDDIRAVGFSRKDPVKIG